MILVCNSYRVAGDAQGACNKKGATSMLQYISEEAADRGLDVVVTTTACLNVCSLRLLLVSKNFQCSTLFGLFNG
jgi:predicted metal-binding protein